MEVIHYNNKIEIVRLVNEPVPSNSYIIINLENKECIIVDPGSKYPENIIDYLGEKSLTPTYIFLTHEHFDHTWGTVILKEKYQSKIVCSSKCREKISVPQNYFNLLYFSDESFFSIDQVDIVTEEILSIVWSEIEIIFIDTPGHSSSSICIDLGGYLFTGDTLMKGFKPFIKKKHEGSLEELKESLNHIFANYPPDTFVLPGHGGNFILKEVEEFYKYYHCWALSPS